MKFAGMIADQDMSTINCKILKENSEEIYLQGPLGKTDVRIINSYPSKVTAAKSLQKSYRKSQKSEVHLKSRAQISEGCFHRSASAALFLSRRRHYRRAVMPQAGDTTLHTVEACQCVGYGISAAVLLGLSVLFLGCNVLIAIRQNANRPPRPLETQLL
jgi:hypothetical protein